MISKIIDPEPAVADIFNSTIAAVAIGASWEVGLLDEVREQNEVNVNQFAIKHNLDHASVQGLVAALVTVDVIERNRDAVTSGPLRDEAYRTKSMFHWLALGSGGLFSRMQYMLHNENRKGVFYSRDSTAIAYACRDINRHHFDPGFWRVMEQLACKFHSVVDLGCGSGERLMQILRRYPNTRGIGIDIAEPAPKVATVEAIERGLGDRLSFMKGDARNMDYCDEFAQVDLLTCFMMGHDFWPRENCIATLQMLRKAFPKVHRFLLGDTTRILLDGPRSEHAVTEANIPVFTLGFEFGHALMGVYLPTIEECQDVFAESGWRCVSRNLIKSPSLSVIFELEHDH